MIQLNKTKKQLSHPIYLYLMVPMTTLALRCVTVIIEHQSDDLYTDNFKYYNNIIIYLFIVLLINIIFNDEFFYIKKTISRI